MYLLPRHPTAAPRKPDSHKGGSKNKDRSLTTGPFLVAKCTGRLLSRCKMLCPLIGSSQATVRWCLNANWISSAFDFAPITSMMRYL